jgi:hypothetical protein
MRRESELEVSNKATKLEIPKILLSYFKISCNY